MLLYLLGFSYLFSLLDVSTPIFNISPLFSVKKNISPLSVQANVYHATKIDGQELELAIKVYKTLSLSSSKI
jgi:hypothetical protein